MDGCGGSNEHLLWLFVWRIKCDVISFSLFVLVFDNVVDLGWVCEVSFPSVEGGAIDLVCTSLE